MPQAQITVNTVAGSNDNVPINTSVQLNNNNTGGELTYLWAILSQPPGTADSLSSTSIQNPTFTPKKEGTYLIRLTVNAGSSQLVNQVIVAVRDLKTYKRIPAAGETNENSASEGWAGSTGASDIARMVLAMKADPGIMVAQLAANLAVGTVVKYVGVATIKNTLPGQEVVPTVDAALATVALVSHEPIGVIHSVVDGTSPATGKLVFIRRFGLISNVSIPGASALTQLYVSDTGTLTNATGTNTRRCGKILTASSGVCDVYFDGMANQ